jgi:DNA-binding transcriptional LysR family regulator
LKGESAGDLAFGASTTIAQYVLPTLLADFSRPYPAIQLQVFSENTEHIAEGVAAGRFGLGLIEARHSGAT